MHPPSGFAAACHLGNRRRGTATRFLVFPSASQREARGNRSWHHNRFATNDLRSNAMKNFPFKNRKREAPSRHVDHHQPPFARNLQLRLDQSAPLTSLTTPRPQLTNPKFTTTADNTSCADELTLGPSKKFQNVSRAYAQRFVPAAQPPDPTAKASIPTTHLPVPNAHFALKVSALSFNHNSASLSRVSGYDPSTAQKAFQVSVSWLTAMLRTSNLQTSPIYVSRKAHTIRINPSARRISHGMS